MKALSLLSDLTIVIPSYERQNFLRRQIRFWSGSSANLIIIDGSETPLSLGYLVNSPNILYLHSSSSFSERLYLAGKLIKTKYAVMLGDDEFLLPQGLCVAIKKLDDNPFYVACIGQSLGFFPSKSGESVKYGKGYPHWGYEINQNNPVDRMQGALGKYNAASCYAVMRADAWRLSWGIGRSWASPYVAEMLQAISTYISGKLTSTDQVYWMRSSENKPISIAGSNRTFSFEEWWISKKFHSEKLDFINILAQQLRSSSDLSLENAAKSIEESVELFIKSVRVERGYSTGNRAIKSFLRTRVAKLLKATLSEEQFIKLKDFIYDSRSNEQCINLVDKNELNILLEAIPFNADNELIAQLSIVESSILNFYAENAP